MFILPILTVRNPQQAISLSAESLMLEAEAQPELFQPTHLRLFAIIRSSSEFVTALLEGVYDVCVTVLLYHLEYLACVNVSPLPPPVALCRRIEFSAHG